MHELNQKLFEKAVSGNDEYSDSIIRTWLEEKSRHLPMSYTQEGIEQIRTVLGLSSEEPVDKRCSNCIVEDNDYCGHSSPPKPETQEKGEDSAITELRRQHYDLCNRVLALEGTPRPVKVSRREKLSQVMFKAQADMPSKIYEDYKKRYDYLADAILACLDEGDGR
jgi:hypothetical protein